MYKENTANYPRLKTDVLFADYENTYKYDGFVDRQNEPGVFATEILLPL